jgi:hypothetical protein
VVVPGLCHSREAEVYANGGIRSRGAHCGGARNGRSIGLRRPSNPLGARPAGQEGVEQMIKSLTEELRHVMVQLGVAGIDALTPDLLVTSAGRP